jgi:hypothetical protein
MLDLPLSGAPPTTTAIGSGVTVGGSSETVDVVSSVSTEVTAVAMELVSMSRRADATAAVPARDGCLAPPGADGGGDETLAPPSRSNGGGDAASPMGRRGSTDPAD